mgnify:CR=1 FL=1
MKQLHYLEQYALTTREKVLLTCQSTHNQVAFDLRSRLASPMEQILLRNLERCLHNRIHYLDHHLVHNRILERNVEVHVVVVELAHG